MRLLFLNIFLPAGFCYVLCCFSFPIQVFSQKPNIDSLKELARNSENAALLYLQISNAYMPDSVNLVELYAGKALEESRKNKNKIAEAKALHQLGVVYQHRGIFDKALEYYKLALAIRNNLPPDGELASTLNNLGSVYQLMNENHMALEYYLNALNVAEKSNDQIALSKSYNNLGIISKEIKQYDRALHYFQKSLQLSESLNNLQNKAYSLNNIGLVYKIQGNFTEAIKYLERSLEVKKQLGNLRGIGSSYNNIGNVYIESGNVDKAIENFSKAYNIQLNTHDSISMIPTLINFSTAFRLQNNFSKSINYLEKAARLAERFKQEQSRRDIYSTLADMYAMQNNYKLAYQNKHKYSVLSDSLALSEINKTVIQLQTKFETKEKEKENEILRQHNEIQQKQLFRTRTNLIITILSLLIIILLSVFVFINYNKNKKINRLLKEKNRYIEQMNAELQSLNDELEKRIQERTMHLQDEISVRKETERLLKEALTKTEKANLLKEAFLANISHEIRTPLNGIMGFSNLLKNEESTEEQKAAYLDTILSCSNQLLNIINDIIEISKIESGQVRTNLTPCSLAQILNDIYYTLQNEIVNKNKNHIEIRRPDAKQWNFYFLADYEKIQTIVKKLISNAVKFTNFGFIEYGCKLDNVLKNITFYIKDTGIGIEQNDQQSIFEHFRQADNSLTRIYGGTGLGLSISKGLIEIMGGSIDIESEKDKGTTISFTVPIQSFSHEPVSFSREENQLIDWSNKTLLIIEDDVYSQNLLAEILSHTKIKIITAIDGESGIELIKQHHEINLVLIDIRLPGINGFDTAKEIKKISPNIPLIALTATSMSEDKVRSIEAGCNNYLVKPIQKEKLLQLMMQYFA